MSGWKIIPNIKFKVIAYGSAAHIWGISPEGDVYQYLEGKWYLIEGQKFKSISVGNDGTVWGVSESTTQNVYKREKTSWYHPPNVTLNQIAVGSADKIWGVTTADKIFKSDGSTWTEITGSLICISVGSDGTVWGTNAENHIYRRDGNGWTKINGSLSSISVGSASEVWGLKGDHNIYKYTGNNDNPWIAVPIAVQTPLKQISVGSDGTIWGVDNNNQVLCNYYLKDSHLLVSAPKLKEVRLEQGDEALYGFKVTNISSGAKLVGLEETENKIEIELHYKEDDFGPLVTIDPVVIRLSDEQGNPLILNPGDSAEVEFKITAGQEANIGTYWFDGITAKYSIVPIDTPAPLPIESDIKGFVYFKVVQD